MAEGGIETVEGAVVFTDIVGFTEYNAIAGDEQALDLLATQEEIVEAALPTGARIVKELGDGLLLWFPDACAALETTLELQTLFEAETSASMKPLWVRIGVHWGRQVQRRGDVLGHDVNVAARIVDIAGAGEVVVSEATLEAMTRELPGVGFEELGPVVMKGVPEPIRLFRAGRDFGDVEMAATSGGAAGERAWMRWQRASGRRVDRLGRESSRHRGRH